MNRSFNDLASAVAKLHNLTTDNYIQESALMHSVELTNVGGMIKLNDATTDKIIGISDFTQTLLPVDQTGMIYGLRIGYAMEASATPAELDLQNFSFSSQVTAGTDVFPAWLLNSEFVMKYNGSEAFRMRVGEIVPLLPYDKVPSDLIKEIMKPIKIEGGRNLELFLDCAKHSDLSAVTNAHEYLKIVLYTVKVVNRKVA